MLIKWPSAESLNRIHDLWEEYYSDPANRHESFRSLLGVEIVSGPVHPFDAFTWGAGKYIRLPEHPTMRQKLIAFVLLKIHSVNSVCRENNRSNTFRWNAREIFSW